MTCYWQTAEEDGWGEDDIYDAEWQPTDITLPWNEETAHSLHWEGGKHAMIHRMLYLISKEIINLPCGPHDDLLCFVFYKVKKCGKV